MKREKGCEKENWCREDISGRSGEEEEADEKGEKARKATAEEAGHPGEREGLRVHLPR